MLKFLNRLVNSKKIFKPLRSGVKSMSAETDIIQEVVCKESDIPENGMKEFPLNGGKVLLVKQEGQVYAVGTKCNHYGAPLVTGTLAKGRIRCPWHGACFNLINGDIEDFPGLDSLPCYEVSVQSNGDVEVRGKKSWVTSNVRQKPMVPRNPTAKETFVIIGGGASGAVCAETLRQEGFTGRILILSNDRYLPYDRVKVSKILNADINNILLRKQEFYDEHDIEVRTNELVVSVDSKKKSVKTKSGKEFSYTKLFVGIGASPRIPTFLEGYNLQNIFTIRSLEDGHKIFSLFTPEANLVIIGSSFIAMESAAFAAGKVKSVTVFGRSEVPFENILGKEIGARIAKLYETKGVKLVMKSKVEKFLGENGKLTHVVVNGESVPADVCILGLGSQFDTGFLKNTGVKLTDSGCVEVDDTNVSDIYVGGDIAYAPVLGSDGKKDAIGHWQLAQYHGSVAAKNMAGKCVPIKSVPFFFSMLFGNGLRYAGYGVGFDNVYIAGDLENLKFVAYFCKGDEVIAAGSMASDPIVAKFADLIYEGRKLYKNEAIDNKWIK